MDSSSLDYTALFVAIVIAAAIAVALLLAHRDENTRRGWITAGVLAALLIVLGFVDLRRRNWTDIHLATLFIGAALPVLGATGMVRGTRRLRPWFRWPLVFATTLVLLFGGLLIGATLVPRLFPF